jgi:hypothetical protein
MINQEEFFQKYPSISRVDFLNSSMVWQDLVAIYYDFKSSLEEFNHQAEFIFKKIIAFKHVHSCKFRVKDPEHLIEKIIRKNLISEDQINLNNYRDKLHDLIGLRAIHLYKEDWENIDTQIKKRWGDRLHGKPVANIREGDNNEFIKLFEQTGGHIKMGIDPFTIYLLLKATTNINFMLNCRFGPFLKKVGVKLITI